MTVSEDVATKIMLSERKYCAVETFNSVTYSHDKCALGLATACHFCNRMVATVSQKTVSTKNVQTVIVQEIPLADSLQL